jgi:BirA family biotin operon repressor/biotin-[acetyl-CoA-carboxylase] ligase
MISAVFHRFEEVGSTNDIALEMARAGAQEGTVVTARGQSKGRGRRGRRWLAKPGESILMSVILRPKLPLNRYSELSFVAAVALAQCLRTQCGLEVSLKWPNDALIGERKVAGILVEAGQGAAIIGIGVNVNQSGFPPELADTAASLAIETGAELDVDALMQSVLKYLFAAYQLPFEEILARWRKYMWGLGCSVEVITEGEAISGAIAGVDEDGALLVKQDGGITRRVMAADAILTR